MPQDWTIGEKCKFAKKDGHGNNVYYVSAQGADGEITEDAYIATKKDLSSGDQVYADLETNDFGQRLRPKQRERGGGGEMTAAPDRERSIELQVCVKAASLERGMTIAASKTPVPIKELVSEYHAALASTGKVTQDTAPEQRTESAPAATPPQQDDDIPFAPSVI